MNTIHLEPNDALKRLAGMVGYTGRKFKAQASETVTMNSHWDGGSRDTFHVFESEDGVATARRAPQSGTMFDPHAPEVVTTTPSCFVVEHSIFCGKDMGLTLHVHASMLPKLLPSKAPLTEAETYVLLAASGLKASYDGRKPRRDYCAKKGIPAAAYDAALETLKAGKYLNKAAAVTVKGRNAVADHPSRYCMI